jgi:hypothetical protein
VKSREGGGRVRGRERRREEDVLDVRSLMRFGMMIN